MLKHENFVYWLQGFFEISGATSLTEAQTKVIKEHLELCFEKVAPSPPTAPMHTGGLADYVSNRQLESQQSSIHGIPSVITIC